MSYYKTEEIPASDLLLDFINPRHDISENQREAIFMMLEKQKKKILRLAEDIVVQGTNPSDLPIVLPHETEKNKYIVLEGNRRLTAIRLLENPTILDGNKTVKQSTIKAFKNLSKEYNNPITMINCVVVSKREDADHWILLRHTGLNEGAGIDPWGTKEQYVFLTRQGKTAPSLQVIDFVKEHGNYDSEAIAKIESIKITNLKRLLDDPSVREVLGISFNNGMVETNIQKQEVLKGLSKIVEDVAFEKINVNDIYYKDDRTQYLHDYFNKDDYPDLNKKTKSEWGLTSTPSEPSDNKEKKKSSGKRSKTLSTQRNKLIPYSCKLVIEDKRINAIYWELRKLDVENFKNAVAVLFRVFIELSVDYYIDDRKITIKTRRKLGPSLSEKILAVAQHFEDKKFLNKNKLKGARTAASARHSIFSIDTFHAYVHSRDFTPDPTGLKISWDNLQVFIEKLWDKK